jgi:hypothetical protein
MLTQQPKGQLQSDHERRKQTQRQGNLWHLSNDDDDKNNNNNKNQSYHLEVIITYVN